MGQIQNLFSQLSRKAGLSLRPPSRNRNDANGIFTQPVVPNVINLSGKVAANPKNRLYGNFFSFWPRISSQEDGEDGGESIYRHFSASGRRMKAKKLGIRGA